MIAVSAGEDSVKRLDISSCPLFDAIKLVHFYAGSWSCIQVDMNEETAACSRVPLDAVRCAGNDVEVEGLVGVGPIRIHQDCHVHGGIIILRRVYMFEEEQIGVAFGISVQFLYTDDLVGLDQVADHGEAGITTFFARQTMTDPRNSNYIPLASENNTSEAASVIA